MLGRVVLPVAALVAAAAIVGTSAAATGHQAAQPGIEATPHASIAQYLTTLGVRLHGRHVVVQRGTHNFVGTTCPGITWTCTTPGKGKLVVQFAKKDGSNQFVCTPSSAGPQPGPNDCTVVQVSSDGSDNNAECVERSSDAVVAQSCSIQQINTTGNNHARIVQQVDVNGGSAQNASQDAEVYQESTSGENDARVQQSINQKTNDTASGSQSQDGQQTAGVNQQSDTGDDEADVDQSLKQNEEIAPLGGKNPPAQAINQTQDANGSGPNLNAAIYQSSSLTSGGNLDGGIDQSINEHMNAPKKNVTGSQQQGHAGGGVNGHFDQQSSGAATAQGKQSEHQDMPPNPSLSQTQFDPAWMGSPQGTNPADDYSIDQHVDQQAGPNADEHLQIYTNCDTSGNCTGKEDANQNGTHFSNSCRGSSCHFGVDCESGGETAGCTPVGPCEGDCGTPPPPPPPPPPPDVCSETCIR